MTRPSEFLTILEEPNLEFRHKQRLHDPRNGLSLFGPYDADLPSRPGNITYGVIGTAKGIERFSKFSAALSRCSIPNPEKHRLKIWRPWPGFEAAFHAEWPESPAWVHELNLESLIEASRHGDEHQRAYQTASQYLSGLETAAKRDENFGLFFCLVPDEVYRNCRPRSRVSTRIRTSPRPDAEELKLRRLGQTGLFGTYNPLQYRYSVDFRRQLKARSMQFGFPLQLIRESTLRLESEDSSDWGQRKLTPLADRAWNLATTAYYKAGGKPWRLASARSGVCYVGLAFRRTRDGEHDRSACCAAQMFLDTGDGVVFKGEYGPWFSPSRHQFHLSEEAAHGLMSGVLSRYKELGGEQLTEVFLHSRSTIDREEFAGYRSAVPESVNLVGIRVRPERGSGVRLFRQGEYPVIRGTLWKHTDRTAFLWGSGFIPSLTTYPGSDVPLPLRIDIEHGSADIEQVSRDILGLTKLNYNACRVGDRQPVTVGFSDKVGEILISNRPVEEARPQFKFYI